MKKWSELSTGEKAMLDEEQIVNYENAAGMEAGLLRPLRAPKLNPVPEIESAIDTVEVYALSEHRSREWKCSMLLGVSDPVEFKALLKSYAGKLYVLDNRWNAGQSHAVAEMITTDNITAEAEQRFHAEQYNGALPQLIEREKVMSANKELLVQHEQRMAEWDGATTSIRQGVADARGAIAHANEMFETFEQFTEMAEGDAVVAVRFMTRAYTVERMLELAEVLSNDNKAKFNAATTQAFETA